MLSKTRGVVFNFIKYRESSIIAKIFTEEFGLQSYIVNSVRSAKARPRMALFQPLTLLDLVVYHKENGNIHRISEVRCLHPYQTISDDFKKSTIAIFLTEVLNRSLKEETKSEDLFEYIASSLMAFDTIESGYENFHLQFLLKLSRFLGFAPSSLDEVLPHVGLDLQASFTSAHRNAFKDLLTSDLAAPIGIDNNIRRDLLEAIISFYQYNQENFAEIKSLGVLREVLY